MKWHHSRPDCARRLAAFRFAAALMTMVSSMLSACGPDLALDEEAHLSGTEANAEELPSAAESADEGFGQDTATELHDAVTVLGVVACNRLPSTGWVLVSNPFDEERRYERYEFTLVSSTPNFNVSETRIAINNLDTPSSVTFTSQHSRTFSISAKASMTASIGKFLTASLDSSIQLSRTTMVGVSTTSTVPPLRTVRGEYGVRAYNVVLDVRTFERHHRRIFDSWPITITCRDLGVARMTTNAPTYAEGWRISLEP